MHLHRISISGVGITEETGIVNLSCSLIIPPSSDLLSSVTPTLVLQLLSRNDKLLEIPAYLGPTDLQNVHKILWTMLDPSNLAIYSFWIFKKKIFIVHIEAPVGKICGPLRASPEGQHGINLTMFHFFFLLLF